MPIPRENLMYGSLKQYAKACGLSVRGFIQRVVDYGESGTRNVRAAVKDWISRFSPVSSAIRLMKRLQIPQWVTSGV